MGAVTGHAGVAAIREYQQTHDLNDEEMARRLGVSRVHWNLVKNWRQPPGVKVWRGATKLGIDLPALPDVWT